MSVSFKFAQTDDAQLFLKRITNSSTTFTESEAKLLHAASPNGTEISRDDVSAFAISHSDWVKGAAIDIESLEDRVEIVDEIAHAPTAITVQRQRELARVAMDLVAAKTSAEAAMGELASKGFNRVERYMIADAVENHTSLESLDGVISDDDRKAMLTSRDGPFWAVVLAVRAEASVIAVRDPVVAYARQLAAAKLIDPVPQQSTSLDPPKIDMNGMLKTVSARLAKADKKTKTRIREIESSAGYPGCFTSLLTMFPYNSCLKTTEDDPAKVAAEILKGWDVPAGSDAASGEDVAIAYLTNDLYRHSVDEVSKRVVDGLSAEQLKNLSLRGATALAYGLGHTYDDYYSSAERYAGFKDVVRWAPTAEAQTLANFISRDRYARADYDASPPGMLETINERFPGSFSFRENSSAPLRTDINPKQMAKLVDGTPQLTWSKNDNGTAITSVQLATGSK